MALIKNEVSINQLMELQIDDVPFIAISLRTAKNEKILIVNWYREWESQNHLNQQQTINKVLVNVENANRKFKNII